MRGNIGYILRFAHGSYQDDLLNLLISRADELQDLLVTGAVCCSWYELDVL